MLLSTSSSTTSLLTLFFHRIIPHRLHAQLWNPVYSTVLDVHSPYKKIHWLFKNSGCLATVLTRKPCWLNRFSRRRLDHAAGAIVLHGTISTRSGLNYLFFSLKLLLGFIFSNCVIIIVIIRNLRWKRLVVTKGENSANTPIKIPPTEILSLCLVVAVVHYELLVHGRTMTEYIYCQVGNRVNEEFGNRLYNFFSGKTQNFFKHGMEKLSSSCTEVDGKLIWLCFDK